MKIFVDCDVLLDVILGRVDFLPASAKTLDYLEKAVLQAINLPMKDFEDAMQCSAALTCQEELIVTRNINDYVNLPVKTVTPDTLLTLLEQA